MAQKRFTFEDETETVQSKQPLSQIDQYENYRQSEEKRVVDKIKTPSKTTQTSIFSTHTTKKAQVPVTKKEMIPNQEKHIEPTQDKQSKVYSRSQKPKQKVKKKTKRKTKKKTKVMKEKKHRSWFSTLILFLISLCIIAGIGAGGYIAYQYYLKQQEQINNLQDQLQNQQKTPTQEPPVQDDLQNSDEQNSSQENHSTENPNTTPQETPETNTDISVEQ